MHENTVREWAQDAFLKVLHVSCQINSEDIFIKEMQDGAHFQCLQDSFMCPLSDFLQHSMLDVHLLCHHDEPRHLQILPSATSLSASFTNGSYLSALCSSPLTRTLIAVLTYPVPAITSSNCYIGLCHQF